MPVPPVAPAAALLALALAVSCSTSSDQTRADAAPTSEAPAAGAPPADEARGAASTRGWREIPTRAGEAGPTFRRHLVDVIGPLVGGDPALSVSAALPAQMDPAFGGPARTAARVDEGERRVWVVGDAVCAGLEPDGESPDPSRAKLELELELRDVERGESHASHRDTYVGRGDAPEPACDRALEQAVAALQAEWPQKIRAALAPPAEGLGGALDDEGVRDPTEAPLTAEGASP